MKIVFIRPHLFECRSFGAMEPLVFAVLAAITPPDVEIILIDERIEPIPSKIEADLVAITVETYTARRAYEIATLVRANGTPVILGGYHTSFAPEEALCFSDSVVIGDADDLWPVIVEDARQGNLRSVYRMGKQPCLDGSRFDRSIFKGKRYSPITPVQFGRGCRFACDFCSIHAFYGSNVRSRPISEFVEEIKRTGKRYFLIVDDNLFVNTEIATELCRALIPLKIRWTCQISLDVARNSALMDLMAKSGCIGALIGLESLTISNLRQMKKGWNLRYGSYVDLLNEFYKRGIMVYGSFIFGYDHDDTKVFDRTVEFAIDAKLALGNFTVLTPTPGAELYTRLQKEGRLLYDRWWLDTEYRYGDATFLPKLMSPDELTAGAIDARNKFYSYSSIFKRACQRNMHSRSLKHLALYLLSNYTTRRELKIKIGKHLGQQIRFPLADVSYEISLSANDQK